MEWMCNREMNFQLLKNRDVKKIMPFYEMRPNRTCDSGMLDTFIWKDYCDVRYCIVEDRALFLLMKDEETYYAALPYCEEQDLPKYFTMLQNYFNEQLHMPLKIYLADEEGVEYLHLKENRNYLVKEEEDLKDYLYDGESMRTLAGKKLQAKRNQIHKFNRIYEGRWEYRTLSCENEQEIIDFVENWFAKKISEEEEVFSLLSEKQGILEILKDCSLLPFQMGGIYIDNRLEAFSVGTLNRRHNMAVINIEKGNSDFPGIYQVINQQFLLHEFPDAEYVNREDDMGLLGLRRAKSSYQPVDYVRKYMVVQQNDTGIEPEQTDFYRREEIQGQNRNIRVLDSLEEKQCTKALYQEVFSDSGEYVDYYYREKCKDNRILIKEEGKKVCSMVHLNPYSLMINGKEIKTYCIAAVATVPKLRHKGYMRELLEEAFRLMKGESVPFCYLIPVDERIYEGMGFERVCSFFTEKLPYETVSRNYDIYPKEDDTYKLRKALEEQLFMEGDTGELPAHPAVMAKIIDQAAFDALFEDGGSLSIQEITYGKKVTDAGRLALLKKKTIYICDEV